jgi:adenylate kinase
MNDRPRCGTRQVSVSTGSLKRVLMLGKPGAGKRTQAPRLAQALDIAHVSAGDPVRQAIARDGPVGRRCDAYVAAGRLVPTLLVASLLQDALRSTGAIDHGFVLDGFPRTLGQLQMLDELLCDHRIDAAIVLEIPWELVSERLAQRGVPDDEADTVVRRREEFEADTRPMIRVLDARGLLYSVDGGRVQRSPLSGDDTRRGRSEVPH